LAGTGSGEEGGISLTQRRKWRFIIQQCRIRVRSGYGERKQQRKTEAAPELRRGIVQSAITGKGWTYRGAEEFYGAIVRQRRKGKVQRFAVWIAAAGQLEVSEPAAIGQYRSKRRVPNIRSTA